MAAKKPAKPSTQKKASKGFTAAEKEAMRERVREMKSSKGDGEGEVLAKIKEMKGADRTMAERIHALIKAKVPELTPRTWYGMPAYANQDDKIVCFFQSAAKFKARYATFGFSDQAKLDDGTIWPTSFALKELDPAAEAKLAALVKQAVG